MDQLDDDTCGKALKWQHRDNASSPLLDGANMSLNFRHMLISCDGIQSNTNPGKFAPKAISVKVPIHQKGSDSKSALDVRLIHMLDGLQNCFGFLVRKKFGSTEFYMT
jgi:hypothetical protein